MRNLELLTSTVRRASVVRRVGRICSLTSNSAMVASLSDVASVGHRVEFGEAGIWGEVVRVAADEIQVLIDGDISKLRIGQAVRYLGEIEVCPDDTWLGRVIDSDCVPLDGVPLIAGTASIHLKSPPPRPTDRKNLGARLSSGYAIFNTMLPIAKGQRVGLFSGSGVGKSSLMAAFARELEADVVVIALIGERGREVNEFVHRVLGKRGLRRSIVVAATSDRSALSRRRAAFTAMAIAEHFRNQGKHVLLMLDSITRLAEAHREIATTSGEPASMRGFPPSLVNLLAGFAERAGPGSANMGDISAIFTVLVSGSDMEEPVSDTLRGLLDGHFVLSRTIAERGRFPAIDVLQSVSRCLPEAAEDEENALILEARRALSIFEESEIMVRSGLYQSGTNPELDRAIALNSSLDAFASERVEDVPTAFERLRRCLEQT